MKVLIRTDASLTIGSGHVARCLTLAESLRGVGASVTFACRTLVGNRIEQIAARGFRVIGLPAAYPGEGQHQTAEEAIPWQADVDALTSALAADPQWNWLLVDHYGLDAQWESALRPHAKHLAVIDDLANRPHSADLLIDQNATASEALYRPLLGTHSCHPMLGPKYALVAKPFSGGPVEIRPTAQRILLNFGGADPRGLTLKAVKALVGLNDIELIIVAGADNPSWDELSNYVRTKSTWRLHRYVEDFAALMRSVDLFIGAGGSTSWERAALGLPTICLSIAPNQVANAQALADAGAHIYLGDVDKVKPESLSHAATLLLENSGLRRALAFHSKALVDAKGADRVAGYMVAAALHLRQATLYDAQLLYDGRNHPEVRRWSRTSQNIIWEDHVAWLNATLASPQRLLLIAEAACGPVGVLRYDLLPYEMDCAEVSIYLLPGFGGYGFGTATLKAGEQMASLRWSSLRRILATVRQDNLASVRLFANAGYEQQDYRLVRVLGVGP